MQEQKATEAIRETDFSPGELDNLCINTIRFLAVDAVEQAKSGHPGMPMGAAPMAYVLWTRHLRHNPRDPKWPNRDRFVLSAGHGSMLLYALLHLTGYDLPMEELQRFRQWGSRTPGHPEYGLTPGVETTTGPLGQGFGNAVGMAIAEQYLAAHFNRDGFPLFDHFTYVIASDGDLMEGISHEAASLAGHLGLGKLIVLYDDNDISIDGSTDITFTEDVGARFEAYGWHVQRVDDGNDLVAIDAALRQAKAETERPSLIIVRTHIGYGSPNKQDTPAAHGAPLGPEEVRLTKRNLGWPEDRTFYVPDEVYRHMRQAVTRGQQWQAEWEALRARYREAYPAEAAELDRWLSRRLPEGWSEGLPTFEAGKAVATRNAGGAVLDVLAARIPELIGGSADLAESNKTHPKGREAFSRDNRKGGYIHFGVREHAMAAICNGLSLHGLRAYASTFLVFSDYLRPSLRLSALMEQPVIYVFTHDSIGLGEDGPTHQPIEHLASLRAIPHVVVLRPADATETVEAWKVALEREDGPTVLVLTRQNVPVLDRSRLAPADGVRRGAYVLKEAQGALQAILLASGSEVHVALAAAEQLEAEGIGTRVVSVPSWELFKKQEAAYRESVLPPEVTVRVAVEAGVGQGWEQFVGCRGRIVSIERFGASAPGKVLFEKFGFTPERVASEVRALLAQNH
ncbi:transketolase [Rhodothermus marinus]|uniref:Transketolase n=1 Tax=Rhodothermus marinus (strain ATCC 43812 / DSM 4252 / R-10) TaxID=518766 RepID=D0MES4_RHOM4|nr:transketolase [Rhodothermus marinus]ACY47374.1 transketolase [Rhodothermus marinus DSM 4252]